MTKAAAIQAFMSQFGIPAYSDAAVPENAALPYITYTPVSGSWGDGQVPLYVNIWTKGSEADINARAEQIGDALGIGGVMLPYGDGAVWLMRGTPFSQAVQDTDSEIKRRYINITAEFI